MNGPDYDAIVIGARCAGAPTAMLLARAGYDVLLTDRATFPSDTLSTHIIHPPGVAALDRWGLLDRLEATGCPRFVSYAVDFGPLVLEGEPAAADGIGWATAPRRTVLDELLVEAASEAGAEVREGFTVEEILSRDGRVSGIRGHDQRGTEASPRARVVVGADGRHSALARAVQPEEYNELPTRMAMYYAYWSGLPVDGFKTWLRAEQRRGFAVWPTHDDLTVVVFGWPVEEFKANRADIEGNFLGMVDLVPEFAERVRAATRESKFAGSAELPGYFRRPFGSGWALVGDAGYRLNPITGFGITDAFRDAELVAGAIDDSLAGRRDWEEAMGSYQRARDAATLPMYGLTDEFAQLLPPPPDLERLLGAMPGNQEAIDAFVSVLAGTLSPEELFAPDNVARILAAAETPAIDKRALAVRGEIGGRGDGR
jgi:2-polyprenyl-6-methoxyphenol hydroxylase-like FAD-dependent oxidoreductase